MTFFKIPLNWGEKLVFEQLLTNSNDFLAILSVFASEIVQFFTFFRNFFSFFLLDG